MSESGAFGKDPLRVLFIEAGVGFGGSILSLADLIQGFQELAEEDSGPRIVSTILTHLPGEITDGLFPHSEVVHKPYRLNYRIREAFGKWVDGVAPLRATSGLWMKAYTLADYFHDRFLVSRIVRLARARQVDLIHLNNGFMRVGLLAAKKLNLPCVVHLRGFGRGGGKRIERYYGSWLWEVVTSCIGVSEAVAEGVRRTGAPAGRVHGIHDAIDVEGFSRNEEARRQIREAWGISQDSVVASVFGRVTGWKGQLEFLEGMTGVVEACENLKIMIVGDESDAADRSYLEKVMAVARDPRLEGKVIFTGYRKNVADFFSATDVVVHSSTEPEPFGRVVPEGMACGCAVIGMDEGGPPEVITHGVDGWLVPPRDPSALGEAVRHLYHHPELRAALGEAGVKAAWARFTPKHHAREVLACYPRIVR